MQGAPPSPFLRSKADFLTFRPALELHAAQALGPFAAAVLERGWPAPEPPPLSAPFDDLSTPQAQAAFAQLRRAHAQELAQLRAAKTMLSALILASVDPVIRQDIQANPAFSSANPLAVWTILQDLCEPKSQKRQRNILRM
jgi:hypothetical protein